MLSFVVVSLAGVAFHTIFSMKSDHGMLSGRNAGNIGMVMLGDSLTFRTDWNRLLNRNDVKNCGINGDTTRDILRRMDTIIRLKPEYCFAMAGINDISLGIPVREIFHNYTLIIGKLMDNGIRPVIQSTLFVTGILIESEVINGQVRRLNQKLKEFAVRNAIPFIDLNQTMSDEQGLLSEYAVDGIHLSQKGYLAWSRILNLFFRKLDTKQ
jgi:lysophospholipase L1-like esterase